MSAFDWSYLGVKYFTCNAKKAPCGIGGAPFDKWQLPENQYDYKTAKALTTAPGVAGFGPVLNGHGLVCLDIDHASQRPAIVADLFARFPGTPAERSTSGDGYHIYMWCDLSALPEHRNRSKEYGLEFYTGAGEGTARFIRMTEEWVQGDGTLLDCTPQALQFLTDYGLLGPGNVNTQSHYELEDLTDGPIPEWNGPTDDDVLLEKIAKNRYQRMKLLGTGEHTFMDLHRGDVPEGFHSEAVSQYLGTLALHTGYDQRRMLRILESGQLIQSMEKWADHKWDRLGYGEIVRACEAVKARRLADGKDICLYSTGLEPMKGEPATEKKEKREAEISEHGYVKNEHVYNALLYLNRHYPGGTLVHDGISFYAYSGKVWERFEDNGSLIKHLMGDMFAGDFPLNMALVNGTLEALRVQCHSPQHFGPLDNKIIFTNGVLCLYTFELLPHGKNYLTTHMLPFDWDPHATCPHWDAFVGECFSNDPERIQLLKEIICYCISPSIEPQKVVFLKGPGRAGKGTIGRLLKVLIGPQAFKALDFTQLKEPNYIYMVQHASVLFEGDVPQKIHAWDAARISQAIKKISGGDEMIAHKLQHGRMDVKLNTRMVLAGNSIPDLGDHTGALGSRFVPLLFDKSHIGSEDLHLFEHKLVPEMQGIITWAMAGLTNARALKFTQPDACAPLLNDMLDSYNPLAAFIRERLVIEPGARCSSEAVYSDYCLWLESDRVEGRRKFIPKLKDALGVGPLSPIKYRRVDGSHHGFVGLRCIAGDLETFGEDASETPSNVLNIHALPKRH